ncbi:hypothetical protein [Sphingosinicella sp. CPCC 101087]|uniref:hypothetical protein n=1 Tax=Sphingosinicella sp. CPCC 101087 TaxID=2497754 RepID=UPI00101B6DC3|nr:hypothetical protein [Sphingosinicella sp. CPCC 101087]
MIRRTDSHPPRARRLVQRKDSVSATRESKPPEAARRAVVAPRAPGRATPERPISPHSDMAAEVSVAGCNARAAADRSRAATMDTANGRRRLEGSATSWAARAGLLQRDADGFEAVRAIARAEWKEGEEAARHVRPDDDLDP